MFTLTTAPARTPTRAPPRTARVWAPAVLHAAEAAAVPEERA